MTPWVITALVIISLVLLVGCAGQMLYIRELREDLDLVTRNLIDVLDQRADGRKLTRLNGSGSAKRH